MLATRSHIDTIAITYTFGAIEAAAYRVIAQAGSMTCQRCLLCHEACSENAINVRRYSGVQTSLPLYLV
jgi:ferredoxin